MRGLAECLGQVKVCGLVTLGVWRLLDGLGDLGVLGELLEIMGASRQAWCTRFETHRSGDGERVLLVSTCVFVTQGGAILYVSAPTWTRGKRQLLDTTRKNLVASCPSYLLLTLTFSTSIPLSSFFVLVLACFSCVLHILPRLSYCLLVCYLLRKLVIVCSSSREEPF
jgi:hypothetical protein